MAFEYFQNSMETEIITEFEEALDEALTLYLTTKRAEYAAEMQLEIVQDKTQQRKAELMDLLGSVVGADKYYVVSKPDLNLKGIVKVANGKIEVFDIAATFFTAKF